MLLPVSHRWAECGGVASPENQPHACKVGAGQSLPEESLTQPLVGQVQQTAVCVVHPVVVPRKSCPQGQCFPHRATRSGLPPGSIQQPGSPAADLPQGLSENRTDRGGDGDGRPSSQAQHDAVPVINAGKPECEVGTQSRRWVRGFLDFYYCCVLE